MTGVTYYGADGWWIDLMLTGLDPSKRYTFATSASRAKSNTEGSVYGGQPVPGDRAGVR